MTDGSFTIHDDRVCILGEGPLWHPERRQFFWFDILENRLMTREGDTPHEWVFDEHVSAAGWVDRDTLLVASASKLIRLDLTTGTRERLCDLEADDPATRSNDGRADRHGGFWIGTMSLKGADEAEAGAIWRWRGGELRKLVDKVTISNAICFSPDGRHAYFADTAHQVICRVEVDDDGWPADAPRTFVDLRDTDLHPDGAVTDADGNLWNAQYGAGRIACYSPEGKLVRTVELPASNTTCPAFGGPDLSTLYCTTAAQGIDAVARKVEPRHGMTFAVPGVARGLPEPRVIL